MDIQLIQFITNATWAGVAGLLIIFIVRPVMPVVSDWIMNKLKGKQNTMIMGNHYEHIESSLRDISTSLKVMNINLTNKFTSIDKTLDRIERKIK